MEAIRAARTASAIQLQNGSEATDSTNYPLNLS